MEIHREIKSLEEKLADVEGWESRVKELEVLLSAGGISSSAGASSGECS